MFARPGKLASHTGAFNFNVNMVFFPLILFYGVLENDPVGMI